MFVGHLGAGLAAKRIAPRLNLGALFLAAMLLDALLLIFVLLGLEQVHIPANFGEVHYLTFSFPYSHGLIASLTWWIYLGSPRAASGAARWGLGALVALCALLTVMGGLATTPPLSSGAMAATSLAAIGILSALAFWMDRPGAAR